ncbi:MAG: NeuD/PglB/VioB family sugar acetyltransferase [Oscillospiraceae bacterium]|nr:NeuD/PglB/VioB family sugar acetyltransferase [Oscillospiraceae bacterium]
MKDLVIIGAGGFGRETLALVEEINEVTPTWNFVGFIADYSTGESPEGYSVLGDMEYLKNMNPKPHVVIAIANAAARERLAGICEEAGIPFATLIHPTVRMKGKLCTVGEGSILCEGVILAVNSHVGKHCIMNMECGLGHDTVIADYVSMMSETITGGDTYIGKGCYFGLRCTIINKINITENCTFGAAAVVVKDATVPGTYVGVPAKLIKPLQN